MQKVKTEFGGGTIHPLLKQHLKPTVRTKTEKQTPRRQFGGGNIHPKVKFGGGTIHPLIERHLS